MKKFRLLLFVITLLMTVGGGIIPAQAAVSQIAAGAAHTIALKTDGTLWAWGWNGYGQLGNGTTIDRTSPVQIGTDTDWSAVAAGDSHTIAMKADGSLWAWGQGLYGRLGTGTTDNKLEPVQIGTDTTWTAVAAGGAHTIALKTVAAETTLWAWGLNDEGQLGDYSLTDRTSPVKIGTDTTWTTVTAGGAHTMALQADGTLWAWGSNLKGQLGIGNTGLFRDSPEQIGTDTTWTAVTAGFYHTIALKTVTAETTLWAWGLNNEGQLGDGTTTNRYSPFQIGTASNWSSVAAGYYHSIALQADGTLWAWGWNGYGQLGDGTTTSRYYPLKIGTDTTWTAVTAGGAHTITLKTVAAETTLWAWGFNANGQLGDGTTTNRTSPVLTILLQHALTVIKAGTGAGTVTNALAGIDCGSDCSEIYDNATSVTLTATPAAGSVFSGWSGDNCNGTASTLVVLINGNTICTATFQKKFPWPMFLPAITRGIR